MERYKLREFKEFKEFWVSLLRREARQELNVYSPHFALEEVRCGLDMKIARMGNTLSMSHPDYWFKGRRRPLITRN